MRPVPARSIDPGRMRASGSPAGFCDDGVVQGFGELYSDVIPINRRFYSAYGKSIFDLFLALLLLIPVIIVCATAGLVIYIQDGGPVLFRQTRVGRNGREFRIWKLRTMRTTENNRSIATGVGDCRITPVGRFLRKYRLDEFPQILNIICGDMSFVGPRPEQPDLANSLSAVLPDFRVRTIVEQGLTGWAQVNSGYAANMEEFRNKIVYDLEYIRKRGFLFDLWILFLSVRVVITGKGAR